MLWRRAGAICTMRTTRLTDIALPARHHAREPYLFSDIEGLRIPPTSCVFFVDAAGRVARVHVVKNRIMFIPCARATHLVHIALLAGGFSACYTSDAFRVSIVRADVYITVAARSYVGAPEKHAECVFCEDDDPFARCAAIPEKTTHALRDSLEKHRGHGERREHTGDAHGPHDARPRVSRGIHGVERVCEKDVCDDNRRPDNGERGERGALGPRHARVHHRDHVHE